MFTRRSVERRDRTSTGHIGGQCSQLWYREVKWVQPSSPLFSFPRSSPSIAAIWSLLKAIVLQGTLYLALSQHLFYLFLLGILVYAFTKSWNDSFLFDFAHKIAKSVFVACDWICLTIKSSIFVSNLTFFVPFVEGSVSQRWWGGGERLLHDWRGVRSFYPSVPLVFILSSSVRCSGECLKRKRSHRTRLLALFIHTLALEIVYHPLPQLLCKYSQRREVRRKEKIGGGRR